MKSVCRSLLVVSSLAGLAACDLPYPSGAYEPEPVDVQSAASAEAGMASPDGGEPAFGGLGGTNGGVGGTQDGGGGIGGSDAGGSTGGGPLDTLAGDYYVRVDQYNKSTGSGMTVSTHATSYLVAKLVVIDGVLKMADRQCFIQLDQTGATTTIPTSEQKSYTPAERVVKLVGDKWNTERGPYPLGWKPSSADPANEAPPTDDTDPRLVDNDGNGNGVNVRVNAGLTCNLRVVQKIDLLFSGTLEGGKLVTGKATNNGSVQNVIRQDAICPSTTTSEPSTQPDTVRFAPASAPLDLNLACPASRAVFEAALPSP